MYVQAPPEDGETDSPTVWGFGGLEGVLWRARVDWDPWTQGLNQPEPDCNLIQLSPGAQGPHRTVASSTP